MAREDVKKTVYLIRHGETESVHQHRHQCNEDPLNEEGLRQARVLAERMTRLPVEIILSSTASRALQTAEAIQDVVGVDIVPNTCFNERKNPSELIGKVRHSEEVLAVKKEMYSHESEPDWHYSDEENFFDVRERVHEAMSLLEARKEEHIVVVTHGYMKKIITMTMANPELTPQEFSHWYDFLGENNTGITVLTWGCKEKGEDRWRLKTWNDHAHLG